MAHLENLGDHPKAVVWAHNSHLGDARATQMSQRGELNVGQLARERHSGEVCSVGFLTYSGTVTAATEWGYGAERKRVQPALDGSYEALFHESGLGNFLLPLRTGRMGGVRLPRGLLERAIGVIYRPETERWSHYFEANLPSSSTPSFISIKRAPWNRWSATASGTGRNCRKRFPSASDRAGNGAMSKLQEQVQAEVRIPLADCALQGELHIPARARGAVLFAHGSGSSRHSPRNQYVAQALHQHGIGTLLFDLLTQAEEEEDRFTGHLRFNIDLLARRLLGATRWMHELEPELLLGYFGSSTGGGAALVADAQSAIPVRAIVSRGGRPDLAGAALPKVKAATLLIVGGEDIPVIQMNREAFLQLQCSKELQIVPGASHLFEEPGTLEQVAELAGRWFEVHFRP
jgi:pimeloyl-ACP methyl ester carboxylesterase